MLMQAVLQAVLLPVTFKPEYRVPGLQFLNDSRSGYTRIAGWDAQFNLASLRYLSMTGNATIWGSTSGWWRLFTGILFDTVATDQVIWSTLSGNTGIELRLLTASKFLQLTVGNGSTTKTAVSAVSISAATRYTCGFYYDGTNIGISVNNESFVTTALAAAFSPGTAGLNIGASQTPLLYLDGQLGPCGGADGTLTSAQWTAMYNANVPLAYDQIAGAISQQATFFWWELNEPSGTRVDLGYNAFSLTSNNSVGTAQGVCLNAISQVNDLTLYGNNATETAPSARPVRRRSTVNGMPGPRYDGVNDHLDIATINPSTQMDGGFSVFLVYRCTAASGGGYQWVFGEGAGGELSWGKIGGVDNHHFAAVARFGATDFSPAVVILGSHTGTFLLDRSSAVATGFVDGYRRQSVALGASGITGTTLKIGTRQGGTEAWTGDIGLVAVAFATVVPAVQRQMERYSARTQAAVLAS